MKKLIPFFVSVLLLIGILAGCTPHSGGDESTEAPAETTEEVKQVRIFGDDKKTSFVITRSIDVDSGSAALAAGRTIGNAFEAAGISIDYKFDLDIGEPSEYEILVGDTMRTQEAFSVPDWSTLGDGGYCIAVAGNKIVVSGGDSGIVEAAERFAAMIPASGAFYIPDGLVIYGYSGAPFSGMTADGVSLAGYGVVIPENNELCRIAAANLRREVFRVSGILLPEATTEKSGEHNIILSLTATEGKDAGSFTVECSGGNILITGTERGGLTRGIRAAADAVTSAVQGGTYELGSGIVFSEKYGNVVMYEDFGAVGDGKTDDGAAISAAHDHANSEHLPVFAREDATYYIGGTARTTTVRTDTDWSCAHFIFDDTAVENRSKEIFVVMPENALITLTGIERLSAGQKNIGVKLPGDCIVTVTNKGKKMYIRYGSNQNNGTDQRDIIRVDKDGNVSPDTPILWDFDAVTSVVARPIDTEKLYLRGGVFTTVANASRESGYYYRGIRIYRSNVVIDRLEHYIKGEGSYGAPYFGFLIFNGAADSEVRRCVLTGHKTYTAIGSAGKTVSIGTYDITSDSCLGLLVSDTYQSNDINDKKRWGVFASNYSKNIVFENVVFSRFDAHQGVYNVTLKNCRLGHQGINLIGHGTALIENTTVYSKNFITLRSDYGSTWNGDVVIRNCKYIPLNGEKCDAVLIGGSNNGSHDFGYECYLPRTVTIDGLEIVDKRPASSPYEGPVVFANINSAFNSTSYTAKYPMHMTEKITVKGITVTSGKPLTVSVNKFMFAGLEITNAD